MGWLNKIFHRSGIDKNELIRKLAKLRIEKDKTASIFGFNASMVDNLSDIQVAGLPEATIVTIVETWTILRKQGVAEEEILQRIETHRASLGDYGDLPDPLTLQSYIKYRLNLEHKHGAPIKEDFVDYAIEAAEQIFSQ